MKCTLCGREFEADEGSRACGGCPLSGGCDLVKCPNCGFEMAQEPKWIERLKSKLEKGNRDETE